MSNTQIYLQVVGKDSADSTPAFLLFFDNKRYLFNCGEGTQRFCMENKIKLTRLSDLFLTRLHSNVLGGVPGMLLTLDGVGAKSLNIHGPKGTADLLQTIKLTAHVRGTFPVNACEYLDRTSTLQLENAKITIVKINPSEDTEREERQPGEVETPPKKPRAEAPTNTGAVFNYIVEGNPIPGKFDAKKASELGVQKGPLFGQLKSGKAVVNKDGVLVEPSECVEPSTPGSIVLIIDCPSIEYFDLIKRNPLLPNYFGHQNVCGVVHLTPAEVLDIPEYRTWMSCFHKDCNHVIFNSIWCDNFATFQASSTLLKKLNFIDSRLFPSLVYANSTKTPGEDFLGLKTTAAKILMKIMMYPPNLIGIDATKVPTNLSQSEVSDEMSTYNELNFQVRLQTYRSKHVLSAERCEAKASPSDDFKILFLGTGSAIPSKYRNVSGIYLKYDSGFSALLDAGEGTLGQLNRRFGVEEGLKLISNLSCIFISHIHADHNIGVARILQTRYEYLRRYSSGVIPDILVIGPPMISNWLAQMEGIIGTMKYHFIDAKEFTSGDNDWTNKEGTPLGLEMIKTILVPHCRLSYAIMFKHKSSKNIMYSGDTSFSQELIDSGKGVDILIHEATFEDDLKEEAIKKRHSTISEAIEAGRLMQAKFTILTHFSQRYPKIPVFSDEAQVTNQIGVAFDFMDVSNSTLNLLPHVLPSIQSLFVEAEDSQEADGV